ncbi:MAG TPA: phage tail tape measure protein [Beijerinckiaceae bacterium]
MASLTSTLVAKLHDLVSGPAGKAGAALSRTAGDANRLGSAFRAQGGAIAGLRTALDGAGRPIITVGTAQRRLKAEVDATTRSVREQAAAMRQAAAAARDASNNRSRFFSPRGGISLGGVTGFHGGVGRQLGAGMGAMGVVGGAAGAVLLTRHMTNTALSFERVLYDVQRATDASGPALENYANRLMDLARATGKTKEELAQMLAAAGFAGRPVQELMRFAEYAAKATTAWGTSAEETGQALAELGNIYQANQERIEEIGDAVNLRRTRPPLGNPT